MISVDINDRVTVNLSASGIVGHAWRTVTPPIQWMADVKLTSGTVVSVPVYCLCAAAPDSDPVGTVRVSPDGVYAIRRPRSPTRLPWQGNGIDYTDTHVSTWPIVYTPEA